MNFYDDPYDSDRWDCLPVRSPDIGRSIPERLATITMTGVVDLLAPIADTEVGQWSVFVVALGVLAVLLWSRRRV